ncbi:12388_t:CDS:2 [Funneliformis caledonium]|uniref:12388_t:CDS:1 n=1 Tax=Funneliformis caledonium TaxID=1117310 RepID=A0A9N8VFF8_9GLOM|nr:12388_t:CDS:2 [Funneliformis caledonium]
MSNSPLNINSTFEFSIPHTITRYDKVIYTPAFSTGDNIFWQLEFHPTEPENIEFCLLYLIAIPNPDETQTMKYWDKRSNLSAMIYIKNCNYYKSYSLRTDDYSVRNRAWGKNFNKPLNTNYPITIGVTFNNTKLERNQIDSPMTTTSKPKKIINLWEEELYDRESNDIQFELKDGTTYARKSMLLKRSEYFRRLFQGSWSETNKSIQEIDNNSHYVIKVPDIPFATFKEMLRYLYTDEISFNNLNCSPLEIFKIADKYLISNLREIARIEIYKMLTLNNAMNILFSEAWKWSDLKEDVIDFIVLNFESVRETVEFKTLASEYKGHPAGIEIMHEIVGKLIPKKYLT